MWRIIIVILGLIFGVFLSKKVKEEIKQGRKYFLFFEKLILLLIVFFLVVFYRINILILIGIVIGLIIGRFLKKIYFYFGLILALVNEEFFLIFLSLMFLFGFFYGSLNKFKIKNLILDIIVFLIPFSLLLIQSFINGNLNILIGLSIGGIIEWARGSAW